MADFMQTKEKYAKHFQKLTEMTHSITQATIGAAKAEIPVMAVRRADAGTKSKSEPVDKEPNLSRPNIHINSN